MKKMESGKGMKVERGEQRRNQRWGWEGRVEVLEIRQWHRVLSA